MSYEMIFNRLCIKSTNGKVLPIILAGNSSLSESLDNGRWRVARHWRPAIDVLKNRQQIFFDAHDYINEMVEKIDEEVARHGIKWSSCEYGGLRIEGKMATYKSMHAYLRNNVKNAIPIEKYLKLYEPFVISSYIAEPEKNRYLENMSTIIENPNDLLTAEKNYNKLLAKKINNQYVLAEFHWIEENPPMKYYRCAKVG